MFGIVWAYFVEVVVDLVVILIGFCSLSVVLIVVVVCGGDNG